MSFHGNNNIKYDLKRLTITTSTYTIKESELASCLLIDKTGSGNTTVTLPYDFSAPLMGDETVGNNLTGRITTTDSGNSGLAPYRELVSSASSGLMILRNASVAARSVVLKVANIINESTDITLSQNEQITLMLCISSDVKLTSSTSQPGAWVALTGETSLS